jgi:RNA-directed DNA polymerase
MPKRTGHLFENVISLDNCLLAAREVERNHGNGMDDPKVIRRIKRRAEWAHEALTTGIWRPDPYKEHEIYDGTRRKTRIIRVPSRRDQVIQHAIITVLGPIVVRRGYRYSCGSIPEAGQSRAVNAMQRWLGAKKPPKYCCQTDVSKFYNSCRHDVVLAEMRRFIKDERFLALIGTVLANMSPGDVGLAIGYPLAHWLANIVLARLDRGIKRWLPGCKMARYMDDIVILHNNKRKLRRTREMMAEFLRGIGFRLKRNWQVFKIAKRGIAFLSYRFFHGYTILRKYLVYRISRKVRQAARNPTPHNAASVISYMGLLKHCDSYNYRSRYVYPFISIKKCKEVVRNEARKLLQGRGIRGIPAVSVG